MTAPTLYFFTERQLAEAFEEMHQRDTSAVVDGATAARFLLELLAELAGKYVAERQ